MEKNKRIFFIGLCAILMVVLLCGPVISDESIVIIGTVNEYSQIVADNDQVYEIGDTEKGEELAQLVDRRVIVTGTVIEEEDTKVVMVTSYEVTKE